MGLAAQLELLAHALARGVADALTSPEASADNFDPLAASRDDSGPEGAPPSPR